MSDMTTSPWGPPIDVLALLAREEQALVAILSGLGRDDWARPAAEETVQDLAARILGAKLLRLSRDRDEHPPEAGFAEHWLPAVGRLSPEVVFSMLVDSTAQLTDLWKHREPEELTDGVPGWLILARDYSWSWVRQQQIREAVGAPLLDEPEFRTPVVDTLLREVPSALRRITARPGRQIACTVAGAGRWTARATAGGWTIAPGAATSRAPLATLAADADAVWRHCTDVAADGLQLTGDADVTAALSRWRAAAETL